MKLEVKESQDTFGSLHEDQPFYFPQRDCYGVKIHRGMASKGNPNAFLFYKDGNMGWWIFDDFKTPVVAKTEIYIRIE